MGEDALEDGGVPRVVLWACPITRLSLETPGPARRARSFLAGSSVVRHGLAAAESCETGHGFPVTFRASLRAPAKQRKSPLPVFSASSKASSLPAAVRAEGGNPAVLQPRWNKPFPTREVRQHPVSVTGPYPVLGQRSGGDTLESPAVSDSRQDVAAPRCLER